MVLSCGLFALCIFLKRVDLRIRHGEAFLSEEVRMAATGRLMRELIDEVRNQITAKWRGFESVNPVEDLW